MLPNEVFALTCRAYYEEQGLIVDKTNGQFAHCPQPERYGDAGYYLTWEDHQHQGLLQSKDIGECCFFLGHAKKWLLECDPIPENYFELWDIYEGYASEHSRNNNKKLHAEKDELGRSVRGVEGAERLNKEKDELGRSVNAVRGGTAAHKEKDDLGRSVQGVKNAERLNAEKDESGKSVLGVKSGRRMNAEVWESTMDSFQGNAGNVARHNKANGWDPAARVRVS